MKHSTTVESCALPAKQLSCNRWMRAGTLEDCIVGAPFISMFIYNHTYQYSWAKADIMVDINNSFQAMHQNSGPLLTLPRIICPRKRGEWMTGLGWHKAVKVWWWDKTKDNSDNKITVPYTWFGSVHCTICHTLKQRTTFCMLTA